MARQPTPREVALHDAAVAAGLRHFRDPLTGYVVFTAIGLRAQGRCCGSGCLFCPYSPEEQGAAGRPGSGVAAVSGEGA